MQAIIEILESIGIFLAGVATRGALVIGVIFVLAMPIMLLAFAMRAAEELKRRNLGLRDVAGFVFRPDLWYAPTHTWLAPRQGGTLAVGLDDLALRLMPSVTGVEVPPAGTKVKRGEAIATLYAGSRTLSIPSPVDGVVASANRAVLRDPDLVKREGYGRGWVVALTPANEEFAALPRGDRAERFMRDEAARWTRFMEQELGFAAADGGHLVAPAPTLVGEAGWKRLTAAFVGN
jgi:glycine cleavage system H protein